jgi:L-glyceraldehyde 3-phosphate reductase
VLRDERVTSALIGASSVEQLEQNVAALQRLSLDAGEREKIDQYAVDGSLNIWASANAGEREQIDQYAVDGSLNIWASSSDA